MVMTNVFGRIGLVFLIMGLFTVAMAITLDPSGDQSISDISGASRTFSLTSISDNATITWYLNETFVQTNESNISSGITTALYTNNSASAGFWNVSALVVNKSNPSDIAMTRWWWTVTSPVVSTEPAFSSVNSIIFPSFSLSSNCFSVPSFNILP